MAMTLRPVVKYAGGPKEAWGSPHLPASRFTTPMPPPTPTPKPSGEAVGLVLEKMQDYIFRRRIRVKDVFEDYDPLRCGRCTTEQFLRAVSQLVPALTEPEAAGLLAYFTEESLPLAQRPQVVNFLDFARALDEVFTTAGLENKPTMVVDKPGARLQTLGFRHGAVEDERRLNHILQRIGLLANTRGLVLTTCWQDCERSNATSLVCPRFSSKVTIAQFKQHFPFTQHFSEADMKMLIKRYRTDDGTISFQELDKDVSEIDSGASVQRPDSSRARADKLSQLTASLKISAQATTEDLLDKLQRIVSERRLQLSGNFQDFDRFRRGVCSSSQLNAVFTILRIEISSQELDKLASLFGDGQGVFFYRDFIYAITQPQSPESPTPSGISSMTSSKRQHHTLQVEAKLQELEVQIAKHVRLMKLHMKSAFQDFDRMRSGRVSTSQFFRVMNMLQFKLTVEQADLLFQTYGDSDMGQSPRFAYFDFCTSVQEAGLNGAGGIQQPEQPYSSRMGQRPKYFNLTTGGVMHLDRTKVLQRACAR